MSVFWRSWNFTDTATNQTQTFNGTCASPGSKSAGPWCYVEANTCKHQPLKDQTGQSYDNCATNSSTHTMDTCKCSCLCREPCCCAPMCCVGKNLLALYPVKESIQGGMLEWRSLTSQAFCWISTETRIADHGCSSVVMRNSCVLIAYAKGAQ